MADTQTPSTIQLGAHTPQNQAPKTFVRGQTLEFIMELPPTVPLNWFGTDATPGNGVTTTLSASLRKFQNAGPSGFIADLNPVWEPGTGHTKIRFLVYDTANWPLGPVEFDLVMTRTVANIGMSKTYRSLPVKFSIVDGVTHHG